MAILPDRSALGAAPATGDLLFVTDISDTTDAATGTDKKMTVANLFTSPALTTPDLGTPSAGVLTNCTGTAAGLTAGAVSTITGLAPDTATTAAAQPNITSVGTLTSLTMGGDIAMGGNNINNGGVIFLTEQAEADADVAGKGQIWVDTQTPNKLFFTDDAGTDFDLQAPEGTAIKSTGETGGTKFLREDGDGTCSWQTPAGSGDFMADGTVPMTGDIDFDGNNMDDAGVIFLREQAAADADVAGQGQWWVKTATPNVPMFTDDAGTDFQLATLAGTETLTNKTLTSPTLTTPVLGTPSSGNLGSCTAYPGDSSLTTVGTVTTGNVDAVVSAANLTTAGKIEIATAAETTTGTDATRAVSPDGLAGSDFGIRYVQAICFDFTTDTATGDGKFYFHVPAAMDGMNLVEVHAEVITAGTTGTTDIQIHNVDNALDMLSTKLTIDSAETGSDTAATAAVINTSNDHINENDVVRIDVDAVSTTAAKGLIVTMGFQLP